MDPDMYRLPVSFSLFVETLSWIRVDRDSPSLSMSFQRNTAIHTQQTHHPRDQHEAKDGEGRLSIIFHHQHLSSPHLTISHHVRLSSGEARLPGGHLVGHPPRHPLALRCKTRWCHPQVPAATPSPYPRCRLRELTLSDEIHHQPHASTTIKRTPPSSLLLPLQTEIHPVAIHYNAHLVPLPLPFMSCHPPFLRRWMDVIPLMPFLLFTFLLLPTLALSQTEQGKCTMYGHCAPFTDTNIPIDCRTDNPLHPAIPPTFNMSMCPHLQHLPVCCDEVQYNQFVVGFAMLNNFLYPCPACSENFLTFLCDLSCGGEQASFTSIASTTQNGNATVVNGVNIALSTEVGQRLYDSCKNVQFSTTGKPVLPFLGATSMEMLFTAVLDTHGKTPIQYNWSFTDDSDPHSMNMATLYRPLYSCGDKSSNFSCSCGDCPSVCDRCPVQIQPNDTSLVVDGVWPSFAHNYLDRVWYGGMMGLAVYVGVMLLAAVGSQRTGRDALLIPLRDKAKQVLTGVGLVAAAVVLVYVVSVVWVWVSSGQEVTNGDEVGMINVLSSWFDPLYFAFLVVSYSAMLLTLGFFVYRYSQAHPYTFHYHPSLIPSSPSDDVSSSNKSSLLARYSAFVVDHPVIVIGGGVLFTLLCSLGLLSARLESDPIALWVSPSSQVLKDKQYFDDTFGAFYRTEQLIITASSSNNTLFDPTTILLLSDLTATIRSLSVPYTDANATRYNVTLDELCYRPIPGQGCVIESPLEWFNRTDLTAPVITVNSTVEDVKNWVATCAQQYVSDDCRGSIGAPTFPYVVLGGYNESDYTTATAMILTFPLNNQKVNVERAKAWEQALIDLMQSDGIQQRMADAGLHVDYMMERSVEDEIARGAYKDVDIIILSYALMCVYVSCALSSGYWRTPPSSYSWTFPLHTKSVLGLCSLLIVIFSLVVSVGVVSVFGISITPIISEVIPFLVLAIGIDNVFLLSQSFRRQPISLSPATRLQRTLSEVGTGITLAAASECGAFLLGASTDMPAVQAFAAISAVAIAFDWMMQMTVFCAVMVLDARRMEDGRWDLCACVRDQEVRKGVDAWKAGRTLSFDEEEAEDEDEDDVEDADAYTSTAHVQRGKSHVKGDEDPPSPFAAESYLQQLLRRYYLPFLFHPFVRLLVLLIFPLLFFFLLSYGLTHLQLGLNQSTVVPNDSYLQGYFSSESQYLNVGPPVYFVIKNDTGKSSSSSSLTYNYTDYALQDRVCNAVSGCDENSLEGIVSAAACTPGSYIAQAASSWLDTYMVWLTSPHCCSYDPDVPGVLVSDDTSCGADGDQPCAPCTNATSYTTAYAQQRPPPDVFEQWMQQWLVNSTCSGACAFCSAGLFDSINFTIAPLPNNTTPLVQTTITSSRYMSYHTPLRTQSDFIGAISSAHSITDRIQREQGLNVFPYSIIYVYFQQYLDIQSVATLNIGLAFLAIFLLSLVLLRCLFLSLIQVVTIAMIIGDLLGLMAAWSVDFNALSVLNLIMAIGISVEFCIHLSTRFLLTPGPSRTLRSAHSVYTVGASVIEGITLTKVTGVLVLSLASSRVFEVYYFRMYLLIVLLGVGYGLVWLPVVLSVVGSEGQVRSEACCGGWMWGWPWRGSGGKVDDEPWLVVGEDGEEVEEEEEEEHEEEEQEEEEEVYAAPQRGRASKVEVQVDDKERALLDEVMPRLASHRVGRKSV